MSVHDVNVTFKGTGLLKYSIKEFADKLNTGFDIPWIWLDNDGNLSSDDDIIINDNEIMLTVHTKVQNLKLTIENIKNQLPEIDELIWAVNPYWSYPIDENGELSWDLAYWTKNSEYKEKIWNNDMDEDCDGFRVKPDTDYAREIFKSFDDDFAGEETEETLYNEFYEMVNNHEMINLMHWDTYMINNTNI